MKCLKQSTQTDVTIGPIWATADGALKADLAYDASGINCDVYKGGTKADVTLANSSGDGYFRAGSGEAQYLLTLSTGHTDTLGRLRLTLSATGYYMKPEDFMVLPANVYDALFGSDVLQVDLKQILGTTLTETSAGYLTAAFKKLFDVAAPVLTAASVNQTGDSYARLGGPAGASVSADVAAVKAVDDAIKAKTDNLPANPAAVGSNMNLADDAITAGKFDETTAYPLKSADTGATAVARTGADADTLETLSDQMDGFATAADVADAVADELLSGHTTAGSLAKAISDILTDTETTLDGKLNTIDDFLDTEIALILKWFTNKLTRTDNGTTVTYVLYDDDDSTPLKTWVWTKATTTRAKAT